MRIRSLGGRRSRHCNDINTSLEPGASIRPKPMGPPGRRSVVAVVLVVLGLHMGQPLYGRSMELARPGAHLMRVARYSEPLPVQPPLIQKPLYEPQVVLPYEGYKLPPPNADTGGSYIIENNRFVEWSSSRCGAKILPKDPLIYEPSFVIIRPRSEVWLNATAPREVIQTATQFDPKLKTTILVHGYTQSYPSTDWLRKARSLFEIHGTLVRENLIIMDWGRASHGSYSEVAARVSVVGSFLANFLMKLIDLGADRTSIQLIGHSLGAHVSGLAGKRIRPPIGTITALDAAGPCFGKIFASSHLNGLAPDDAIEVADYHYDDSLLGLPGQHGQFDVYVNGGSSQPGCSDSYNSMFQALITVIFQRNRVLSESHTRATEVATSDLAITGCQQVAYECQDYDTFNRGECGHCDQLNNQCFFMGFNFQYLDPPNKPLRVSRAGKKLYIKTGALPVFCLQHYQLILRFEPTPELMQGGLKKKWLVQLELFDNLRPAEVINVTMSNQIEPNVYTHLLLLDRQPARFSDAQLRVSQWDGSPIPLVPRSGYQSSQANQPQLVEPFKGITLWPFSLEINFMSNINFGLRKSLSSRLCPTIRSFGGSPEKMAYTSEEPTNWLRLRECPGPSG